MPEPIELKGAQRTYRLNFGSTNAICRLEEATGLDFGSVLANLGSKRPKASLLRAFVHAALVDPPTATPEECGEILDDIGGAAVVRAAVSAVKTPKGRRRRG